LSAPVFAGRHAATTTTLAITNGDSAVTTIATGTVVTLTATVLAGAAPVTVGQVKFCDAAAIRSSRSCYSHAGSAPDQSQLSRR
jgi:hypothetical protein